MPNYRKKYYKRKYNNRKQRRYGNRNVTKYTARKYGNNTWVKSPRMVMPSSYITTLRYGDYQEITPVTTGPVKFAGYTSNVYDADTASGSHSVANFAAFNNLYFKWRCLRMGYKMTVINKEAFPIVITAFFCNQELTASSSYGGPYSVGNANTKQLHLGAGASGACKGTIKMNKSVAEIMGDASCLYDDDWTGSTLSDTVAREIYLNFIYSASQSFSAGFEFTLEITYTVKFFNTAVNYAGLLS